MNSAIHYIDVTWASWRLKSLETEQFIQQFIQVSKHQSQWKHHRITGPFVRVIHRWPVDSPHKGLVLWKTLSCPDIVMLPPHKVHRLESRLHYCQHTVFWTMTSFLFANIYVNILTAKFMANLTAHSINSLTPGDANLRQWTGPSFTNWCGNVLE